MLNDDNCWKAKGGGSLLRARHVQKTGASAATKQASAKIMTSLFLLMFSTTLIIFLKIVVVYLTLKRKVISDEKSWA